MEVENQENDQGNLLSFTNTKKENLPWVEKYRPGSIKELISHTNILETLLKFVEEKRLPNLLFYGPPGTGKTSTIVALAKQMYGSNYSSMALELNASDDRGINVVRETIKTFASMSNIMMKGTKLIILDEADAMTNAAQFALRRIMEKYAKNARFCLICNYVSKIIPALQSRCTRFKFKNIPKEDAKSRVQYICQKEGLRVTDGAIEAALSLCDGDMRRVVNMLQSVSISLQSYQVINDTKDIVDEKFIYKMTGNASPEITKQIFQGLLEKDIVTAFQEIYLSKQLNGISLTSLVKDINLILIDYDMPNDMKIFLTRRLAEIEHRLSLACSEKIQLGSLVAAFYEVRNIYG